MPCNRPCCAQTKGKCSLSFSPNYKEIKLLLLDINFKKLILINSSIIFIDKNKKINRVAVITIMILLKTNH